MSLATTSHDRLGWPATPAGGERVPAARLPRSTSCQALAATLTKGPCDPGRSCARQLLARGVPQSHGPTGRRRDTARVDSRLPARSDPSRSSAATTGSGAARTGSSAARTRSGAARAGSSAAKARSSAAGSIAKAGAATLGPLRRAAQKRSSPGLRSPSLTTRQASATILRDGPCDPGSPCARQEPARGVLRSDEPAAARFGASTVVRLPAWSEPSRSLPVRTSASGLLRGPGKAGRSRAGAGTTGGPARRGPDGPRAGAAR